MSFNWKLNIFVRQKIADVLVKSVFTNGNLQWIVMFCYVLTFFRYLIFSYLPIVRISKFVMLYARIVKMFRIPKKYENVLFVLTLLLFSVYSSVYLMYRSNIARVITEIS